MKILFVSDTYYPHINGVYYFVRRLAILLQQNGHDVAVIVPSESIHASQKQIDGIDVYGIPSLPIIIHPKIRVPIPFLLQIHLKRLLGRLKPDIVHLQDHFSLARAVLKANRIFGIPIIGTNHFMPENVTAILPSTKWNKQLDAWMWSNFSKVFNQLLLVTTPTEMAASLIRPKLKVRVLAISNGIDLHQFNPFWYDSMTREKYAIPNKPILLYVGRLEPEKHIEEVLHAVALVAEKVDFCFVAVGKGASKSSLEHLAEGLGIKNNVFFTGFVPDEDLAGLYRLSCCFVSASIAELQSIATMEAMASGLPVIAANAGALGELVHHKINGYLFETGDINSIAQYIYNIMGNETLSQEMGEKSLELIQEHDINRSVKSFEAIYERSYWGKVVQIKNISTAK